MKPGLPDLALDFQPPRPGLLSLVLFLAALLVVADAALDERAAQERREVAEQAAGKAEKRNERATAARRAPSAETLLTPAEAKALAVAERAVRVDWERLFGAIDRAVSDDVALLNLRPSVSAQNVQLGGEARDMASVHAFVEALRQAPLARVVLLSHSVRSNEPGRPVAFEISAEWQTVSAR
ncbi:MAG: PilN domain-containing protein [Rhodocyclaceae bacterium]|nr:PilN domain-containing protein [Rhodocyclaceae bacterium]